ncbi:unnamed protein product [Caenorhabditis nigoni]
MPLHIFGAYLIITKTPRNMKTAKYSILQLHLACTVMDLMITSLWIFYSWIPSSSGYAVGLMSNIVYNNFLMIAIGCNGLLTTLVMILVHRPYRISVLEMCGIGTKAEQLSIQAVTLWKMKALGRVSGE